MAGDNWVVGSSKYPLIDGLQIPLEYDYEETIQRADAKMRLLYGNEEAEKIHWEAFTDQIIGYLNDEMVIGIVPG